MSLPELLQQTYRYILDWAEFWTALIALWVYWQHPNQPGWMKPLKYYLLISALLYLVIECFAPLYEYKSKFEAVDRHHPQWWASNTPLYSYLSMTRFPLVLWLFHSMELIRKKGALICAAVYLSGLLLIELFSEDSIFNRYMINSMLLCLEAFIVLVLCMMYYIQLANSERVGWRKLKSFWVVTSIAIFFVINFFVYLFYRPLIEADSSWHTRIWDIVSYSCVISMICTIVALYAPGRNVH